MRRELPKQRKTVEHLIYSDGLATVSVFVEEQGDAKHAKQLLLGASRMGAVTMYGAKLDGYHVTAVGEVPPATVSLIGASISKQAR
jgi:sigma-E factor negative regulatory protein RseB